MTRQTKAGQRVSWVAGVGLSSFELVARHVALLVGTAYAILATLPGVIVAAWQAMPLCGLIQGPATEQLFRLLVSCWP